MRALHGVAILYDCHSIRSVCPFLFEGMLPDISIGTNRWRELRAGDRGGSARCLRGAAAYSSVVNGRFKGGWTTRHYGQPTHGVHAIQMELTQKTHLTSEALPFAYDAGQG